MPFVFSLSRHHKEGIAILLVACGVMVPFAVYAQQTSATTIPNVSFDRIRAVFDFAVRFIELIIQVLGILIEAVGRVVKLILNFIPTLPEPASKTAPTQLFHFQLPLSQPPASYSGETPQQGFSGGFPR